MTKLILVRHGESLGNYVDKFLGHTDLDLSPKGYKQAEFVRKYFSDIHIDKIYSSDLSRAYNTIVSTAQEKGISITKSENLREIYAGGWENKTFDELMSEFEDDYRVWRENIGHAICTGGESVEDLQKRICKEIKKICDENPDKTIVVATHATPIRVFTAKCLGYSLNEIKNIEWAKNASINIFDYSAGEFKMLKYGFADHLGGLVTELPKNV